jgi:hypothetical protein
MNNEKIPITQYIRKEQAKLLAEQNKLRALKGLKKHEIYFRGNGRFYSPDYSLADSVEIKNYRKDIGGSYGGPDGSVNITQTIYFPRFSYNPQKRVIVQFTQTLSEPDFPEDIFLEVIETDGRGTFRDESKPTVLKKPNDLESIVQRYQTLGVNPRLLKTFERKAKQTIKMQENFHNGFKS